MDPGLRVGAIAVVISLLAEAERIATALEESSAGRRDDRAPARDEREPSS